MINLIVRVNLFCVVVILYFLLSENTLPVQFLPSPEYPGLHAQV